MAGKSVFGISAIASDLLSLSGAFSRGDAGDFLVGFRILLYGSVPGLEYGSYAGAGHGGNFCLFIRSFGVEMDESRQGFFVYSAVPALRDGLHFTSSKRLRVDKKVRSMVARRGREDGGNAADIGGNLAVLLG